MGIWGYDGYVRCNCIQQGITPCTHLNGIYDLQTLSHFNTEYAKREYLDECGGEKEFPILTRYFPFQEKYNSIPIELFDALETEIEKLKTQKPAIITKLILKEQGRLIAKSKHDKPFLFYKEKEYQFSVEKEIFIIRERGHILFEAKEFVVTKKDNLFIYTNTRRHKRYRTGVFFDTPSLVDYKNLHYMVTRNYYTAIELFDDFFLNINRLMYAARKVGNPILLYY